MMTPLKYLQHYPIHLQNQVRELIEQNGLAQYIHQRYSTTHEIQTDRALYQYTIEIKQSYLRTAPSIDKVLYDAKLDVVKHALGLNTAVSRVQGNKLKSKKEIRIASLFKSAPAEFLRMIVVHELAHLKERNHDKAFYQLCTHIEPNYHQLEFDLRVYLLNLHIENTEAKSKTAITD